MIALLKIFILWKLLHGDLRLLRIFMFYQLRTNCERYASCTKSITFTNNNLMRHLISSLHNIFLFILHIYDYDIITWIFIGAHFLIRFGYLNPICCIFLIDFIIVFDNYKEYNFMFYDFKINKNLVYLYNNLHDKALCITIFKHLGKHGFSIYLIIFFYVVY